MLSQDPNQLLKALECIAHRTHKCSQKAELDGKCNICEIGFIYIAEQPFQLTCGHCVCTKCTFGAQKVKFKCEIHNDTEVLAESPMARLFIKNNLNGLFKLIQEKMASTVSLFQGVI
jgi:hypothetical protein